MNAMTLLEPCLWYGVRADTHPHYSVIISSKLDRISLEIPQEFLGNSSKFPRNPLEIPRNSSGIPYKFILRVI